MTIIASDWPRGKDYTSVRGSVCRINAARYMRKWPKHMRRQATPPSLNTPSSRGAIRDAMWMAFPPKGDQLVVIHTPSDSRCRGVVDGIPFFGRLEENKDNMRRFFNAEARNGDQV